MLVGQLYLVTVIATLVGNLRHQRRDVGFVAIGVVAQLDQPAAQHLVQVLGADHLVVGIRQRAREEDEREGLAPAHPAVRADELLEGGDLLGRPVRSWR